MGYLLLVLVWQIAPVPDDWEAVHRALIRALTQVSLSLPETLTLQPQVAGEPHQWVVEPLLDRYLQEAGYVLAPERGPVLEFRPLQVHLEKHRTGWWNSRVSRRVILRLWLGLRNSDRGAYRWQRTLVGEYQDRYPAAREPATRVDGLSPPVEEHPHLARDLLATLAVGGLVLLLYSGGHGR